MTPDEARTLLRGHKDALDHLGVRSLSVFGSVARGDAGPDSDVDVLVEFTGIPTFDRYFSLLELLEETFGRPVDLVTRRSLRPELEPRVEREALRVA